MSKKIKILIVDDDTNICELLKLYLDKEGFENIAVHDGKQALEAFRILHPTSLYWTLCYLAWMDGKLQRNP